MDQHLENNRQCKITLSRSLLLLFLFATGCAATGYDGHPSPRGITYESAVDIKFRGFARTYLIHLPPSVSRVKKLPLVIALHGAFDTGEDMERQTGLSDLADQENFIVLYPQGIGIFGWARHWNAGHCCGWAAQNKVDDVAFLAAVIRDALSRLPADSDRVYLTGFSNGGMMAMRFAAERGDLLAAVAPLGATAGGRRSADAEPCRIPDPGRPLPILMMHGLADRHVPFAGGTGSKWGNAFEHDSVMSAVAIWIKSNGCNPQPVLNTEQTGSVQIRTWSGCRPLADVFLYTLPGWEHVWPGGTSTAFLSPEHALYHFDAGRLVWDFFKKYRRDHSN